jgi:hypothetical protein
MTMSTHAAAPAWLVEADLKLVALAAPDRPRQALVRLLGLAELDYPPGALRLAAGPRGIVARFRSGPRMLCVGATAAGTLTWARMDGDRESRIDLVPAAGQPAWLRGQVAWLVGGLPFRKADRWSLLGRTFRRTRYLADAPPPPREVPGEMP